MGDKTITGIIISATVFVVLTMVAFTAYEIGKQHEHDKNEEIKKAAAELIIARQAHNDHP